MNELKEFFKTTKGHALHKFPHYLEIYERHLEQFRGRPVTLVEVGVGDGGSLEMWRSYLGPAARVIGIDISVHPGMPDTVTVVEGDQGNAQFWYNFFDMVKVSEIDILIDDGSHVSIDQMVTFRSVFPRLAAGGIYICEDLQTSYQKRFGGGYRKPGTFIEFAKDLIDQMNAWCTDEFDFVKTDFTKWAYALHFYTYMLVVEKRAMDQELYSPIVAGGQHVRGIA